MAIGDHPWTKATSDAAAVRIAMTVGEAFARKGILRKVRREQHLDTDAPLIEFDEVLGAINSDLTVGTDVTQAVSLSANDGVCSTGVKLHGAGFIVSPDEAQHLGLGRRPGLDEHIRQYRNGRDVIEKPRGSLVIDLLGLSDVEVRTRFPEVYQHILANVKPEREANNRASYRDNWWIFGEPRKEFRPALAGLSRYIVTATIAKHRTFQFLSGEILPDVRLVCFAVDDAFVLGALSSRIHLIWAAKTGATLEDRPTYITSRCFDPFPFPDANSIQKQVIRIVAEEIDAHRKRVMADHPHLTLTGLYNVLGMLRAGKRLGDLDESDRKILNDGLVLILKESHDKLDAAVAEAYGWSAALSDDEILSNLVALNKQRSEEEKRGLVRWLRPDYQVARFAKGVDQQAAKERGAQVAAELIAAVEQKPSFPSDAVEQTAAIFATLAAANAPLNAKDVAAQFKRSKTSEKKISEVLASLARLGYLTSADGKTFKLRRAA